MFELYSTGMKTQQLEEEDEELFICHIQSITRSEMCALLLTHPRAHTPGAVDTHLEQWKHTHTHTHTHTWSSGQSTLRRPGGSWGFSALLKGLTSVVDNSCRSREPTTSDYKSSALSIRPRLHLDFNLQLYCVTSHTVWLSEK